MAALTPFAMDTDYFGSKQQAWMVNFRVRSLDAMVAQLQKSTGKPGITIQEPVSRCNTVRESSTAAWVDCLMALLVDRMSAAITETFTSGTDC